MDNLKRYSIVVAELLGIFVFYLLAVQSLSVLAEWHAPVNNPPVGAVPPPVNVGAVLQEKGGSLVAAGDFASGVRTSPVSGWHVRFSDHVGIGSFFANKEPWSRDGVSLDVAGNTIANSFCYRNADGSAGGCLDFSGQAIGRGAKGETGDDGKAGPVGPTGLPGPQGSAGVDVADTSSMIQNLFPGVGIMFRNSLGAEVLAIGLLSGVTDGVIARDFTVNPCADGGTYINSIDPNGVATCVGGGATGGTVSGIDYITSGDYYPYSPSIMVIPSVGAVDIYVDGTAIQGTVLKSCGAGKAIGQIRGTSANSTYQDVQIRCTPMAATGTCGIEGRTFYCIDAKGVKTSIAIP